MKILKKYPHQLVPSDIVFNGQNGLWLVNDDKTLLVKQDGDIGATTTTWKISALPRKATVTVITDDCQEQINANIAALEKPIRLTTDFDDESSVDEWFGDED